MFTKILIANRGEIACRVIKTARRMGIATVAVYSDADANARHVRIADEAVRIGPAAARESYLVGATILAAAKATGAEAVHPGYGFLSENDAFAEAVRGRRHRLHRPAGVGDPRDGLEVGGQDADGKAGVPLTPGYHGDDQDPALLAREAGEIGFPVLIKASAGGGGKGMRRVDERRDFAAALASCQREAKSAFGDDRVLVEHYVLKPRHIEIQVFADSHGGCVHLFERDCSVQRRHQKVIEEAPAPGMTARAPRGDGRGRRRGREGGRLRRRRHGRVHRPSRRPLLLHGDEHAAAGRAPGDRDDHRPRPGRVAAPRRRRRAAAARQDELAIHGHAIEARIYAEDPDTRLPAVDRHAVHLAPPAQSGSRARRHRRRAGDAITPFYDPMVAKLIVHGADRAGALLRMK